jgi:hypothetical protein
MCTEFWLRNPMEDVMQMGGSCFDTFISAVMLGTVSKY